MKEGAEDNGYFIYFLTILSVKDRSYSFRLKTALLDTWYVIVSISKNTNTNLNSQDTFLGLSSDNNWVLLCTIIHHFVHVLATSGSVHIYQKMQ